MIHANQPLMVPVGKCLDEQSAEILVRRYIIIEPLFGNTCIELFLELMPDADPIYSLPFPDGLIDQFQHRLIDQLGANFFG
jgi:hypothetical protein